MKQMFVYIGVALLVCLTLLLVLWIANRCSKRAGAVGERAVERALKKYARRHGGKVCSNVYLPLYSGSCEIDHLLFCSAGILVVETKHVAGIVSGNGQTLSHQVGRQQHTLYNPQLQNKTHADNVAYHLKRAKCSVPLHTLVVFSNPEVVLHTNAGILLAELPVRLQAFPDRHCDYRAAYHAIRRVQIHSPLKKLMHDWKVGHKKG